MAGGVQDLDGGPAEVDGVALFHGVDVVHGTQQHILVPRPGPVDLFLVDIDGDTGPFFQQAGHAQHMVKVAVGDEDHGQGQARLADLLVDVVRLVAGIDNGADLGVRILQQVAVGADLPNAHPFDLQHKLPRFLLYLMRITVRYKGSRDRR